MHFFKTLLAGVSVLALAAAQTPMITSIFTSLNAGDTVQITWTGGDPTKPVNLVLRSGDNKNNLDVNGPIGSGTGGSYTWVIPSDLKPLTTYAIEIQQNGVSNYSPQFAIVGGTGTGTAKPTASATASASGNSTTITTTASTSASTSSASGNSTSTVSLKTTTSSTRATPTGSSPVAPNANTAAGLASPLALVLSAVMAMIYFN